MSHRTHDLHDEFPQAIDTMRELRANNSHFARLAEQHHEVNQEIHRIEIGVEPASDERTEMLKRHRLALLDEIAMMISAAA